MRIWRIFLALTALTCTAPSVVGKPVPRRGAHRTTARESARKMRAEPIQPQIVNDPSTRPQLKRGDSGSAVLRAQILLARAHFSCGEIDGRFGSNLTNAVVSFQLAHGLPGDGLIRDEVWKLLEEDTTPLLRKAVITPEDVAGPFLPVPEKMLAKAKLPALNYSSPLEAIAEKYHTSPELLQQLNPGVSVDRAGVEILVPSIDAAPPQAAAQVVVSKSRKVVMAIDSDGKILSSYAATLGSRHDPLPIGRWRIVRVSRNPVFHYNPSLFWDAKEYTKATIPPGPKSPVGICWIDLSKRHYGIHGTPDPSQIGKTQSHGCIRLTNWDVTELSQIVRPGTPAILTE